MKKIILFFLLNFVLTAQATTTVLLQGSYTSNPGPFVAEDTYTVSFSYDENLTPSSSASSYSDFLMAANNLVVNVAGYTFTGSSGRIRQQQNSGLVDSFQLLFDNSYGSLTDNTADFELNKIFIEIRGELFTNPSELMTQSSIDLPDSYFRTVDFHFTGPVIAISRNSTVSVTTVPEPSTLAFFISGIALMFALRRSVNRN